MTNESDELKETVKELIDELGQAISHYLASDPTDQHWAYMVQRALSNAAQKLR